MDDINVRLGRLESHDLRELSLPITTYEEYEVGDVVHSEEEHHSTGDEIGFSEDDVVNSLSLEDEIPRHIDTFNVDDDGNRTFNLWIKIYQNSNMWVRNPDGSISIGVGDMFTDKDQ